MWSNRRVQSKPGSWITPYGEVRSGGLAQTLYELAAEHARRSIAAPRTNESGLIRVDRFVSLGSAAELLLKSTLAGITPTLLAGNTSPATLTEFSGEAVALHLKGVDYKVTTVGASDAIQRLNPLLPDSLKISMRKNLFEVRNDAIHMGVLPTESEARDAQADLVGLVDEVFLARTHLGQSADAKDFWSETYEGVVDAIREEKIEELQSSYSLLIATARNNYAKLVRNLDSDRQLELINELSLRANTLHYFRVTHWCPACENSTLAALYDVSREVDVDDSDAPHSFAFTVTETAVLDFATCPVCDLHLNRSSAAYLGIPLTINRGTGDASADEIEGYLDMKHLADELTFDDAGMEPPSPGE